MAVRRRLAAAAVLLLALSAAALVPVVAVERRCTAAPAPRVAEPPVFAVPAAGYHRAEGDSFLSYPEWSIVHAYADLAAVTARGSESDFDYLAAVRGFWSGLCLATRAGTGTGDVTADQTTTNYIIGVSFTAEMLVQGLYERSLGALTARLRAAPTGDDAFNRDLLQRYARFLRQTPWYEFPFGAELVRLWREVPLDWSARGLERRASLSLQYAGKSVYAAALGALAGYAPADLTIRSLIDWSARPELAADPRLRRIGSLRAGDGTPAELVETARYGAFTDLLRDLARGGTPPRLYEIAGNRRILTTVLVPPGPVPAFDGATALFAVPLQAEPGWRRIGYDVAVRSLLAQIAAADRAGARFEHAYDY
jgi:hypothetical protein